MLCAVSVAVAHSEIYVRRELLIFIFIVILLYLDFLSFFHFLLSLFLVFSLLSFLFSCIFIGRRAFWMIFLLFADRQKTLYILHSTPWNHSNSIRKLLLHSRERLILHADIHKRISNVAPIIQFVSINVNGNKKMVFRLLNRPQKPYVYSRAFSTPFHGYFRSYYMTHLHNVCTRVSS